MKVPRFDFAKFPSVDVRLGTSMQSVGEAMAIGRTFPEALQKALRSLETGRKGLNSDPGEQPLLELEEDDLVARLGVPGPDRIFQIAEALRRGVGVDEVAAISGIDPWFIDQILQIVELRGVVETSPPTAEVMREAKRFGFSDAQLSYLWELPERTVRQLRQGWGIITTFKTVDTCAAEFESSTPYLYSSFEEEDESVPGDQRSVVVLGSGPNRIGQGIEFDYCCVHASFALRDAGYETVMVNCNPETVSTDYDVSDRLYFEPLTVEDVLTIVEREQPEAVIVQLGGQTPLNLAGALQSAGVPIAGTPPEAIDIAEDRMRFSKLCTEIGIKQPPHGIATSPLDAGEIVDRIGLPVLVRPSFVLGGRAMRVVWSYDDLSEYLRELYGDTGGLGLDLATSPLLIDRFLESAVEVDVDAVYDGRELLIGGIMEHVEEAGVHSGDSSCVLPAPTLGEETRRAIEDATDRMADALGVRGLLNLQFAVKGEEVFLLEANPRASRTVPFVSKASGIPLAKVASRVMLGATLSELRSEGMIGPGPDRSFVSVKEAVLPWNRFPQEDVVLGPEMRATGEVMGIAVDVGVAYAKALLAAGHMLPREGTVFFSLADRDKPVGLAAAQAFAMLGFHLLASPGTSRYLTHFGIPAEPVNKVGEGPDDTVQRIESGTVDLVVNTPRGGRARYDGRQIRRAAHAMGVPCVTTVQGALAAARSLQAGAHTLVEVNSLQEWHR